MPTKNNKKYQKCKTKKNKRDSEIRQNTNHTRSTHVLADVEQIFLVFMLTIASWLIAILLLPSFRSNKATIL